MKIQYQTDGLVIFESELFRTTTSLVTGADYLLLIDPNWLPGEVEFISQYVDSIAGNREKYLLFTHSDYDHIIGYGKFKSFQTIASENFVINKEKETILEQIKVFDDQYYIKRNYPVEYPAINTPIKGDGFTLQLGAEKYVFYQAVGHNKDGIITYNVSKKILITGDYLSNIEFPYVYESFKEYKETLDKLRQIILAEEVDILITGHGDFTTDKKEMMARIEESNAYIKELENVVSENKSFDTDSLFEKYHFPKVMMDFHKKNIDLLQKEMALIKDHPQETAA